MAPSSPAITFSACGDHPKARGQNHVVPYNDLISACEKGLDLFYALQLFLGLWRPRAPLQRFDKRLREGAGLSGHWSSSKHCNSSKFWLGKALGANKVAAPRRHGTAQGFGLDRTSTVGG